ncbi:MAG: hypothetical protein QM709_05595 [Spongiibacteraceae bacterium]
MIDDKVEVTRVSSRGIWLRVHDRTFFLSYYDFPWFKDKPMRAVLHVEEPTPGEFYWPEINVNLGVDTLKSPHRYPPQQRTAIEA